MEPERAAHYPPHGQVADDRDQLGWNRARHGTFAEHAAGDHAVPAVDADDYLGQLDARGDV